MVAFNHDFKSLMDWAVLVFIELFQKVGRPQQKLCHLNKTSQELLSACIDK